MDITLDVITEEIIAIDVVQESATSITVVTGIPGSNGAGVVAGGTTGQILRKKTNTNFDTEWANPEAAAGVSSVNGATGTVSLTQDDVPDGTTAKKFTATEKTKLAGVATGATANATDANLRDRTTHTGAQAISTVTGLQAAIDAKAPLDSPAFTGTPTGITKAHVGLTNVDNTTDASKPVSTATQTALDGKQATDQDLTDIAALSPTNNDVIQRKAGAWVNRTPAQLKTDLSLAKADVGLGSVDNTADSAKPVSSAQQTALDGKQTLDSDLTAIAALAPADDSILQRKSSAWVGRTMAQLKTDLSLAKADVGLSNVDNTADSAKPISTAQQTAFDARFVWADGTTVSNARPSTSSKVIWVGGTVQPTNMATGDLWIKA